MRPEERDYGLSGSGPHPDGGNVVKLTLAWLLVGVPLVWGVWNTLMNALLLFK